MCIRYRYSSNLIWSLTCHRVRAKSRDCRRRGAPGDSAGWCPVVECGNERRRRQSACGPARGRVSRADSHDCLLSHAADGAGRESRRRACQVTSWRRALETCYWRIYRENDKHQRRRDNLPRGWLGVHICVGTWDQQSKWKSLPLAVTPLTTRQSRIVSNRWRCAEFRNWGPDPRLRVRLGGWKWYYWMGRVSY